MDTDQYWALGAGLLYGLAATWLARVFGYLTDPSGQSLAIGAILSAFGLGGYTWYRIVEHSDTNPITGGAASGLLTGVFAHFLMWGVYGLLQFPTSPAIVVGLLPLAFGSLTLLGLFTLPLASFLGGTLGLAKCVTQSARCETDTTDTS